MQTENFFIDEAILAFLRAILGENIVTNFGIVLLLISKLIIFVIIMAIVILVWNIIVRQLRKRIAPSSWATIKTLGRFGMLLVGFGFLSFLFPDLQGLFIGAGAILGTAIGFASTATVGNFISGLYLIISRPFNVLDYVLFPALSVEGVVEQISTGFTQIEQPDGTTAIVSNKQLLDTRIINTRLLPKHLAKEKTPLVPIEVLEGFDTTDGVDIKDLKSVIPRMKKEPKKTEFTYPLVYGVNPDADSYSLVTRAIKLGIERFKTSEHATHLSQDLDWFVLRRDRLNLDFQINVIVHNPYRLLYLPNELLNYICEALEEEQAKTK
ncbi:MAG: mechanosensitive ion channel domain-containing protein [Promethearchaeota archaeon]